MDESGADAPSLTLLDLPHSLIVEALSSLPPSDSASLACTTRTLQAVADDDCLRKQHLNELFGVNESPIPPPSAISISDHASLTATSPLLSYKQAFKQWTDAFPSHLYKSSTVKASHEAWERIETFLATNSPSILTSLCPGANEDQINHLEGSLSITLPSDFKAIWRFHNGQSLSFDNKFDSAQRCPARPQVALDASIAHGLFGGYSFYDHFKCTRMLSLDRIEYWTMRLRHHSWLAGEEIEEEEGWVGRRPNLIVFAASYDLGKIFVLDSASSEVFVISGGRLQSASPHGILPWFQEYAQRLHEGWYTVQELHEGLHVETRGICLFAESGPGVSVAVTRGVQVKVSTIYAAEVTRDDQHTFAYSVRFRLLPKQHQQGDQPRGAPVSQCQLNSRHWVIRNEDGEIEDEIRGEGVIGMFPHLHEGGGEFRYQSCTRSQLKSKTIKAHSYLVKAGAMPAIQFDLGSMGGDFKFVEGSNRMPTGPTFDVECPSFSFAVQGGFIF